MDANTKEVKKRQSSYSSSPSKTIWMVCSFPILIGIIVKLILSSDYSLSSLISKYYQLWHATNGVKLHVLRNGDTKPCGQVPFLSLDLVVDVAGIMFPWIKEAGPNSMNKYQLDAVLTYVVSIMLEKSESCGITPTNVFDEKSKRNWDDWYSRASVRPLKSDFLKYCDMIEGERLTIQNDHHRLVKIPSSLVGMDVYPCHFHTREGLRITSYQHLVDKIDKIQYTFKHCTDNNNVEETSICKTPTLSLHVIPAGRIFMFAPSYVGEIFDLAHVENPLRKTVYLETISLAPRIFEIHNFFNTNEADSIIRNVFRMATGTHKFKRSVTGATGKEISPTRTSENGFDIHSKEALILKRRCMKVLGFDSYDESLTDGLQVLRYNKTTAYIDHMDYIEGDTAIQNSNYDSMNLGSDRFGTILMYFNDLPEGSGGETVFTEAGSIHKSESNFLNLHKVKVTINIAYLYIEIPLIFDSVL